MQNFSESKRGYAKEEVDAFIKQTVFDYEKSLSDQKDRIFDLLERVKELEGQLAEYKKKDDEISHALRSAVQKAREIEETARLRYDAELTRLKLFHNKWVRYYNEIREQYPLDSDLMSVENFLKEMNRILGADNESIASFTAGTVSDSEFNASRESFRQQTKREEERIASIPVGSILGDNSSEKRFQDLLERHGARNAEVATKVERTAEKLDEADTFRPMERIGAYISSTVKARPAVSDSGFDLNEVLNPSNKLDLGDLCRELGFMDEK